MTTPRTITTTAGLTLGLVGAMACCWVWLRPTERPHAAPRPVDRQLLSEIRRGADQEVVRLLTAGADPNAQDERGDYAISVAAEAPRTARIHAITVSGGPAYEERRLGYPQIVLALLRNGARTNVTNHDGWSPLNQAKFMGYWEIAAQIERHSPRKAPVR